VRLSRLGRGEHGEFFSVSVKKCLPNTITFCSIVSSEPDREIPMRRWTLAAAAAALLAAALWHLPAIAQRAAQPDAAEPSATQPAATQPAATQPAAAQHAARPVAPELISFDEYRDFRMHDLAQRQARLAQELSAPDLSAAEKTSLERRKAYYDQLTAMPAAERDRLFHTRFDQIDTNHDGMLDGAERAAWREKQREHYRKLAAERAQPSAAQH
jgi:hypothetical protein